NSRDIWQYCGARWRRHGERTHQPVFDMSDYGRRGRKHHLHMTGNYILQRGRRALVCDMHDVDMRLRLEQFAGEMCGGAVTRGRKVELAGLCFRESDQFSHRVDG